MLLELNVETSIVLWFTFGTFYYLVYLSLKGYLKYTLAEIKNAFREVLLVAMTSCLGALLWFWGTTMTDPTSVAFILQSTRVFTFIMGTLVLSEKLSFRESLGALFAFLGVFILTFATKEVQLLSVAILLTSAFSYALSNVLAKRYVERVKPLSLSFGRAMLISIILFIYSLTLRKLELLHSNTALGWGMLGALLAPFLTILLTYEALKCLEVSKFAVLYSLSSFFTILFGILLFSRLPTLQQVVGGGTIIAGVIIMTTSSKAR